MTDGVAGRGGRHPAAPVRVPRRRLGTRRGAVMLALAVGFLPFGVPRWLQGDAPVDGTAGADVARLCREHGGSPRSAAAAAAGAEPRQFCVVRYGGRAYVMDAITPAGFDADTASFQRQGCEEAQRASARGGPTFVYHPRTGVCERRF